MEQPYQHALYNNSCALEQTRFHNRQKLEFVETATPDMLRAYKTRYFSALHLEAFVHGNIGIEGARSLVKTAEELVLLAPLAPAAAPAAPSEGASAARVLRGCEFRDLRMVMLPALSESGVEFEMRRLVTNPKDVNSAAEVLLQIGQLGNRAAGAAVLRERMLLELFSHIAKEPLFNQLRTKEQLGYMVFSVRDCNELFSAGTVVGSNRLACSACFRCLCRACSSSRASTASALLFSPTNEMPSTSTSASAAC
jgi:insulysin